MNTHLRPTDHALVAGLAWTAVMRWSSQIVSWAATFFAARMLTPGDFGLIAMAMLAIGLARMVQEFGLDAILVQDRTIVGEQRARVAGLLIGIGILLFAVYAALSTVVAGFFKEPQIRWIVVALGTLFVFDAAQIVPYSQLQRELQFRKLAVVMFVQVFVTSATLVTAVACELGVWSLVVNQIVGEVAVTLLLLFWAPYVVAWPKEIFRIVNPLKQGWRMLVSRFAWYAYTNADQAIIGKVLGKELLGAYSLAQTFSAVAHREIGSVLSRVVPGVFAEVQQQPSELRRYFLILTQALTVLAFPLTIGLVLVADMAVPLLLGDQWDAVITPLRWLCVYSAFASSQILVAHVLLWTGQFRINMWCSILAGVTIPLALLFAVRFGLQGVAMAWALVFPLASLPAFYFAFRTIQITLWDWLQSLRPAGTASALMVLAVVGARTLFSDSMLPIAQLISSVAIGALIYTSAIWFLFRQRVSVWMQLAAAMRQKPEPQ